MHDTDETRLLSKLADISKYNRKNSAIVAATSRRETLRTIDEQQIYGAGIFKQKYPVSALMIALTI